MTTFLSIIRNDTELSVEVDSLDTATGYVEETTGEFQRDQEIQLTAKEQEDAKESMLAKALSLARRDIDFEVDAYTPTRQEDDFTAANYFDNRNRL